MGIARPIWIALAVGCAACGGDPPAAGPVRALDPPRPLSPAPGPTGRGALRPRLVWAPAPGAGPTDQYQVEVGACAGGVATCRFDRPLAAATVGGLTWRPPTDLAVGRVAWRVRACADSACSPWTRPRWLDVGRAPLDLDGDGLSDAIAGAPLVDLGGRDRGAVVIARGPRLAALRIDEPAGADGAEFGAAVAAGGDVDADGRADLIVGAPGHDDGTGRAYVYAGAAIAVERPPPGGIQPALALSEPGGRPGDAFGADVIAADFDGDGWADVAIAAPGADGTYPADVDVGRVLVWRGGPTGLDPGSPRILTAPVPEPYDRFGTSLAAGDLDGDGYADLIVGAPGLDRAGARRGVDRGAVYLYRGGADGLSSFAVRLEAPVPLDHDRFGYAVSAAGDVDGDGLADLMVGAPSADGADQDSGLVYVFLGRPGGPGSTPDQVLAIDPADAASYERFGSAVAIVGDVDGDGLADIVVGTSGPAQGLALVYRGGREGVRDQPLALLRDPAGHGVDDFGDSVAGIGDIDGDGLADVLVGAASATPDGGRQGSILVFRGAPGGMAPTPLRVDGPTEQSHFGRALAGR